MFIEAKSLHCIVAFKPRDIPLSGNRSCVPHFSQLIGKAIELLRIQVGVIAPLRQHMLDTGEPRIGTRHDFGSRRRARRIRKAMGKHHSVFCQFVEMWGSDIMATVGIECFDT